jgi:YHS domain-containing protein
MKRLMVVLTLLGASCGKEEPAAKPAMNAAPAASADKVKDVICGMAVDRTSAKTLTHEGAPYFFCSDICVEKFKADPKKYAVPCVCGKTSSKCICEHCGHHKKNPCDCGK